VPSLHELFLFGHALVGRQDLPIPAWLFAWGASIVLIVSFALLSFAWRTPRLEAGAWRPAPGRLSRALTSRAAEALAGAVGVFLLGVVIWSGLEGTGLPDQNFALTFVFVTFWLGGVLLSVLFGDVMRAFNPWRAIGRAAGAAYAGLAGGRPFEPLPYPERLGRWPAALGILAFFWMELIYGAGGVTGASLTPYVTAVATLLYSLYALGGMYVFGVERWCDRGEAFSVYFGMYSRLAPVEARREAGERRLGFRRPLAGSVGWAAVPGSLALVVIAIGGTAFDGAQEGLLKSPLNSTFGHLLDLGLGSQMALRVAESVFLLLTVAAVAAVFLLGVWGMHTVRNSPPMPALRTAFAHTLLPIALAYLVAHYFSFFVFQEQAQFTHLLSDPLGNGSDYFGTASGGIDYAVISANGIWYAQVAALVIGHVAGLTLGHDKALTIYGDPKAASRSQQWMLSMMVLFTCTGLFLLSQANS
jgi:hypothetical protein